MRVLFHSDYNHRWPSRAATHFRAGWSGSVKREVAQAAVPKYATRLPARDTVAPDATQAPDMGTTGRMAGTDHSDDGRGGVFVQRDDAPGERQ